MESEERTVAELTLEAAHNLYAESINRPNSAISASRSISRRSLDCRLIRRLRCFHEPGNRVEITVALDWNDVSGAQSYEVEVYVDGWVLLLPDAPVGGVSLSFDVLRPSPLAAGRSSAATV